MDDVKYFKKQGFYHYNDPDFCYTDMYGLLWRGNVSVRTAFKAGINLCSITCLQRGSI
jgi:hypothetical protein